MRYLFISPNFPPNFKYFIQHLHRKGVEVFGLGSDHESQLSDELKPYLRAYQQVSNLEEYESVYRGLAHLKAQFGKMDRIESHNEHWLELDAALRTDFNVFGLKNDQMPALKLKSEMKKVFKQLGLAYAPGETFHTIEEAKKIAKRLKYPVVVKPDKGVGAIDTYRLNSEDELEHFFSFKPNKVFIMETFIDAQIETYDGLTDQNGTIVFENAFVYDSGVMDNVLLGKDMYYYTQRKIPTDIREMGRKIVKAYQLKERFFHIEFFRMPDGRLMGLEINARPPGGMSLDMFNFANDADLFEAYASVVVGESIKFPLHKPFYCMYIGIKEQNLSKHQYSIDEILAQHQNVMVYHGPNPSLFGPAIGDYAYVVRDTQIKPLLQLSETVFKHKEGD
jgi:biotin carboxylase